MSSIHNTSNNSLNGPVHTSAPVEEQFETESSLSQRSIIPTAPLPDPIAETIETIVALHTKAEQDISPHQRWVEWMTRSFGRPTFLYSIVIIIAAWLLLGVSPAEWGISQFDPPPFEGLDKTLGIVSLVMTAGVLVRQSRQEHLAEQRAQLSLQLDLLMEQKIAKLIALVEELRRDLPDVHDRYDPQAEAMQNVVDPNTVLETLEQTLTHNSQQSRTIEKT